ncbi:hypothetical protein PR202_gb20988 [Eleusine coracana subsp. coracana]|uniref:Uncharacterized protein n=1 Tax=Eleusine coracana subsp. coracana TaxID=191504 RepID=A0AAV5F9Z3_ELECO|nr:hypothetical protein PR202_gb20988 [Eleusine coracana subsp. coracana]
MGTTMDFSSVKASPSYDKATETYKKAVAAAATMTAYTVLARSMARELFPNVLRAAARWAASVARGRLLPRPKTRRTKTIFIPRFAAAEGCNHGHHGGESSLYSDARAYLATRIDPAPWPSSASPTPAPASASSSTWCPATQQPTCSRASSSHGPSPPPRPPAAATQATLFPTRWRCASTRSR